MVPYLPWQSWCQAPRMQHACHPCGVPGAPRVSLQLSRSYRQPQWLGSGEQGATTLRPPHALIAFFLDQGEHVPSLCNLRHALDWIARASIYSDLHQEQATSQSWNSEALLHTPPSRLPLELKENVLKRDT